MQVQLKNNVGITTALNLKQNNEPTLQVEWMVSANQQISAPSEPNYLFLQVIFNFIRVSNDKKQ